MSSMKLLSVYVGMPREVDWHGRLVLTSIMSLHLRERYLARGWLFKSQPSVRKTTRIPVPNFLGSGHGMQRPFERKLHYGTRRNVV
jgi:hypothetical protein